MFANDANDASNELAMGQQNQPLCCSSSSPLRHRSTTASQALPLNNGQPQCQSSGSCSSITQTQPSYSHCDSTESDRSTSMTTCTSMGSQRRLFRKVRRGVRRRLGGKESALLVLYTFGLLISSCGNSILFKKMTTAMPNYGWFLSQVTCLGYIPIFGAVVIAAYSRGDITEEMTKFPKRNFAIMGLMDSMVVLMSIVGGAFTTGPTQLVLGQAVIPVTLALASVMLGQRFHFLQYIGAIVIIAGVLASKWPLMFPDFEPSRSVKDQPIFNIIYACAAIPNAMSQIWKEVAFKDRELDVNFMQYWVAVFQVLIGFLIAPLNALPILGSQRIPLDRMSFMVTGGSACLFMGKNSIVDDCGGPGQALCDDCHNAWIPVVAYFIFNVFYNIFTLLIVKHGGAALSFVVATLRLPLTTLCFYSAAIVGVDATNPNIFDLLGLVVLVSGLACYRYGSAVRLEEGAGLPAINIEGRRSQEYSSSLGGSNALEVGPPDHRTLLPITEEDEGFVSEGEEFPLATLVVEPGPYILRVHSYHTKPLYLGPIRASSDDVEVGGYVPPTDHLFTSSKNGEQQQRQQETPTGTLTPVMERPPRRRTMHDFRDSQIQKIHQRRLLFGSPSHLFKEFRDDHQTSSTAASLHNNTSDDHYDNDNDGNDSDDGGYLSDGSVNSLTGVSRPKHACIDPHPLKCPKDGKVLKPKADEKHPHRHHHHHHHRHKQYHTPESSQPDDDRPLSAPIQRGHHQQLTTPSQSYRSSSNSNSSSISFSLPPSPRSFLLQHSSPPQQPSSGSSSGVRSSSSNRLPPLSVMLDGGLDLTVTTSPRVQLPQFDDSQ